MQFCGSWVPGCPQPGLFSTAWFPQSPICWDRPFVPAHLFTGCLHAGQPCLPGYPLAGTQTRVSHGAGILQTSVRGMSIEETNVCAVPPHVLSPVAAAHQADQGAPCSMGSVSWCGIRRWERQSRPASLSCLAGCDLLKTKHDRTESVRHP